MSRRIPLTFACGDCEIMRALKEGSVMPLTELFLNVSEGRNRNVYRI
jgi:hypothetical protein